MKNVARPVLLLAFFCALLNAPAQGNFEAITAFSQGSVNASVTGTGGWTFQPVQGIQITDLGCLDFLVTDQGPITIGLWNDSGTLLASGVIASTNTLINQSRYTAITPLTLSSGQRYRLGAFAPSGTILLNLIGPPPNFDGSATLDPLVQLGGYATGANGFVFPSTLGPNGTMFLGPNFRFNNLPEPSGLALLGLGVLLGLGRRARRRHYRGLN